ncbi:9462_t:CDS:1, partial [Racocetra fulgida]
IDKNINYISNKKHTRSPSKVLITVGKRSPIAEGVFGTSTAAIS